MLQCNGCLELWAKRLGQSCLRTRLQEGPQQAQRRKYLHNRQQWV